MLFCARHSSAHDVRPVPEAVPVPGKCTPLVRRGRRDGPRGIAEIFGEVSRGLDKWRGILKAPLKGGLARGFDE